jgi:uncharacterized repeat protein (TIGR02543 family)
MAPVLGIGGTTEARAETTNDLLIEFNKTYGGSLSDYARYIIQTSDGGYAVAGYLFSSDGDVTSGNNGSVDFWIVKLSLPITSFNVSFDSNGGSLVESITLEEPSTITRPVDPTKTDFNFNGWYEDSVLTIPFDFSQTVSESMTLYAKWSEVVKDQYTGSEDIAVDYTEEKTDIDRTVTVTATPVEGTEIRSISLYMDGNRVARNIYTNTLTATISKEGDYEVVVANSQYESGTLSVYDLTEPVVEEETPLEEIVNVVSDSIDYTATDMLRSIKLLDSNGKRVKSVILTNTFNYTPKEGGDYTLKTTTLDRQVTEHSITIAGEDAPVIDNPNQIVDANFTSNRDDFTITVNVTPSDLASTRSIELFKDGRRIKRAIFSDTLSVQ